MQLQPRPVVHAEEPTPALTPPPVSTGRVEWVADFEASKTEAAAEHKRILSLFTGSDWCPASMDFEAGVAHNADFLRITQISFVLLKPDYPQNTPKPETLRAQKSALMLRNGSRSYPTPLVMSADGAKALRVDTRTERQAAD